MEMSHMLNMQTVQSTGDTTVTIQSSKAKKQTTPQYESSQHIRDKMKSEPGYTPTFQEEAIIKAIEEANQKINGGDREFEFGIHTGTKQITVKIIDTKTREVLKEIPPEKILDMVASLCEFAGLFVDEKR